MPTHAFYPAVAFDGNGLPVSYGKDIFVKSGGTGTGKTWTSPLGSWQDAINEAVQGDRILGGKGSYDEALTNPIGTKGILLVATGGMGSVSIKPSTTNAIAFQNEAEDILIWKLGFEGNGTGGGFLNHGRRLRTYWPKCEGGAYGFQARPDQANYDDLANPSNDSSDMYLYKPELCWATKGAILDGSTGVGDFSLTQCRMVEPVFHDNTSAHIADGAATRPVLGLIIERGKFLVGEDGATPTVLVDLDRTGNTGQFLSCEFSCTASELSTLVLVASGVANVNPLLSGVSDAAITRTTMSGNVVLVSSSNQYQMFDPDGSNRNVDLPAEATGMAFVIKHFGSANTITVRDDAAATVATLTAGDTASVVYDGTAWQVL